MRITSQMLANLKYDNIEMLQEPNSLKINSESKIKFYKIEGLLYSYREVQEKIGQNIDQLAQIESNQMCIPFTISKKYFGMVCEPIEFSGVRKSFKKTTLSATWKTNIFKFFENLFIALYNECKLLYIEIDPPREKLMKYFFENILKVTLNEAKPEDKINNNNILTSTNACVIFKTSDVNAAVQQIIESLNDPFNFTSSITSIFVQESAYNDLCEKLKFQLKPYPHDVLRDQFFVEEYDKYMDILKELQPKLIQLYPTESNNIVPAICCDFNYKYFQTNHNLLIPIITLQSFRTVKECLSLLSEIENICSKATIWSYNFAAAYEIMYKSSLCSFELNCYNITTNPFYKIFDHSDRSDFSETDDKKNGVVNTNTHHYQFFQYKKGDKIKFKTIIMAFGVTFAN